MRPSAVNPASAMPAQSATQKNLHVGGAHRRSLPRRGDLREWCSRSRREHRTSDNGGRVRSLSSPDLLASEKRRAYRRHEVGRALGAEEIRRQGKALVAGESKHRPSVAHGRPRGRWGTGRYQGKKMEKVSECSGTQWVRLVYISQVCLELA
jgi:hypothetical protein